LIPAIMRRVGTLTPEIVLVHSSDLHIDENPHQGTAGLRAVLNAAREHRADYILLVGDVFDSNRQTDATIARSVALLRGAPGQVIVLPGNHDPVTPDTVWRRGGLDRLRHVHVIGVTHALAVHFRHHDLEVWGHAHVDYNDMAPLRTPKPRSARWHVALAHGHYEDDGVPPLRPSWLISNAAIEATGADYLALGHWNRAARVGTGVSVPAYYSGSPDLAKTVNVVRLRGNGTVEVTREALGRD
jgi:DNA repair exonuclease SbcCD nuclease subunit